MEDIIKSVLESLHIESRPSTPPEVEEDDSFEDDFWFRVQE